MLDEVYDILNEKDIRITPQRRAILEILYSFKENHLDTENIYRLLASKKGEKASLATVYRTMELFEKIGIVSRLELEDLPARFELVLSKRQKHHHLICLQCGKVEEIDHRFISDLKEEILREKDFQIVQKPIKIYGYCKSCRKTYTNN
ncbi:MAG: Fur family transcriptional regulator [Clostridia bacterium]|nr:Fur family transcriptional regulator [Clostridia bacterium]